jgi:hypothetical protein
MGRGITNEMGRRQKLWHRRDVRVTSETTESDGHIHTYVTSQRRDCGPGMLESEALHLNFLSYISSLAGERSEEAR